MLVHINVAQPVHCAEHCALFIRDKIDRVKYLLNPSSIYIKCPVVIDLIEYYRELNFHNDFLHAITCI